MLGGLVRCSAVLRALSGGSVLLHVAQACSRLLLAFPRRACVSRGMCNFFRISGQAVRGSRDFDRIFLLRAKDARYDYFVCVENAIGYYIYLAAISERSARVW